MTDRRISKTKQAIQKAFFTLLEQYPVEKISIKKLCDEADINRGTFYIHYEDYPMFLKSLDDLLVEKYISTFDVYHFDKNTSNLLEKQFGIIKMHSNLFSLFFRPEFHSVREKCIEAEKKLVLPMWLKHSDVTEQEAEIIFTFMINGIFSIYKLWIDSDFSIDESKIMSLVDTVGKYGVYHYIYTKE